MLTLMCILYEMKLLLFHPVKSMLDTDSSGIQMLKCEGVDSMNNKLIHIIMIHSYHNDFIPSILAYYKNQKSYYTKPIGECGQTNTSETRIYIYKYWKVRDPKLILGIHQWVSSRALINFYSLLMWNVIFLVCFGWVNIIYNIGDGIFANKI